MVDINANLTRLDTATLSKFEFAKPIVSLFKECTPRILVVADGSLDFGAGGFGLDSFINTLKTGTVHGMTPIVETAHRRAAPCDHPNFHFTDTSLKISKYDVLMLFGIETSPPLPAAEVDVIAKFMQAGGGVFATGDHDELGKALCNELPRVRSMRYWTAPDVPSGSGADRLSTNLPGSDNIYQFDDQSDAIPQRIYPKYYLPAGSPFSASHPHALLQHPTKRVIEVFPDHPHEGECVVPSDLATSFSLGGKKTEEWPKDSAGARVEPELIALSMSYGGGFSFKHPLTPRSFGAIGAYDGHRAQVGRVSVDATWHHFININITGAGSPRPGLQANPDAIDRVRTYFQNLPEWLMPRKRRLCLRWPLLIQALELYPIPEILPELRPPLKDLQSAIRLGTEIENALRQFVTPAALAELSHDLIALHDEKLADELLRPQERLNNLPHQLRLEMTPTQSYRAAVLGIATGTILREFPLHSDREAKFREVGGMEGIERLVREDIQHGIEGLKGAIRENLAELQRQLG